MSIGNCTEFVKLVENKLGWVNPAGHQPGYKKYSGIARRVKDRMAETGYTLAELELAVELLWRERKARSPLGVFSHVERAREKTAEPESDVETEIRYAMRVEEALGDPEGWVTRFARATGRYRAELLNDWKTRWAETSRGRD